MFSQENEEKKDFTKYISIRGLKIPHYVNDTYQLSFLKRREFTAKCTQHLLKRQK